jgi:hypothetical protein
MGGRKRLSLAETHVWRLDWERPSVWMLHVDLCEDEFLVDALAG